MPRPRTNPDKHRKNVALTLDPDLLTRARALAAQNGRSLSQLVEQLLVDWVRKTKATDADIEVAIEQFIDGHEKRMKEQDGTRSRSQKIQTEPTHTTI